MGSNHTVEYKTTNKSLPIIVAPFEVEKGDVLELHHEKHGVMFFFVESIVGNTLELEEYRPMLITV